MPNTDWMATLSNDLYLPQLSIPGTHDTGCYQYTYVPMVRTQRLDIPQQLAAGVRAFDVRCGLTNTGRYHIFHGSYDQEIVIRDVARDIANFVTGHAGEVVLLMLKAEYGNVNSGHLNTIVNNNLGGTLLAPPPLPQRWPTLGECRGRVLVLSRLPAPDAAHYSTVGWPDNCLDGRVTTAPNCDVRIQDRWNNPWSATKRQAITDHLNRANTMAIGGNSRDLFLNFCSASWIGYEPLNTAPAFNQHLVRQFNAAGVIFVDDVSENLATQIISWNPRPTRERHEALEAPPPRPPRRARRGSA